MEKKLALQGIMEAAANLGVELDEAEAVAWLRAIESEAVGGDIVVDVNTGVFGHRVAMLDFRARDIERFRAIGRIVGFADRPPTVRTALAISGSAAQGKVQSFPGDCDFFERIHITTLTREEACNILATMIREKALGCLRGPSFRLAEVKFGNYPFDGERDGRPVRKGTSISWNSNEVTAGAFSILVAGEPVLLKWNDVMQDPGWCKLDWVVADPDRSGVAWASNVLDATWQAPDGTITALDGHLESFFQEVYLDTEQLPAFTRIVKGLEASAVDDYVEALRGEVRHYTLETPNPGKVARRLYNIFRLSGHYTEAAYVRELFDEPTTALYALGTAVELVDDAHCPESGFEAGILIEQIDQLIMAAIAALEGREEQELVHALASLRAKLVEQASAEERALDVTRIRREASRLVDEYFDSRLQAIPSIAAYIADVAAS